MFALFEESQSVNIINVLRSFLLKTHMQSSSHILTVYVPKGTDHVHNFAYLPKGTDHVHNKFAIDVLVH